MAKNENERSVLLIIFGLLAFALVPFLPLLFSGIEILLFGSDHVEESFKTIGLHEPLCQFYQWIFSLFSS